MVFPVYVTPYFGYSPVGPIMPQARYFSPQMRYDTAMPKSGYSSASDTTPNFSKSDDELSDILDADDPLMNDHTTYVKEEFFTSRFAAVSRNMQRNGTDCIPRLEIWKNPVSLSIEPVDRIDSKIEDPNLKSLKIEKMDIVSILTPAVKLKVEQLPAIIVEAEKSYLEKCDYERIDIETWHCVECADMKNCTAMGFSTCSKCNHLEFTGKMKDRIRKSEEMSRKLEKQKMIRERLVKEGKFREAMFAFRA